jgi:hypothetical protein
MVWPPKIEYEWISTSAAVKSAYRRSMTPPPNKVTDVSRFGTFHRPRRSKPLMIARSSVDGAGWPGPIAGAVVAMPGRSELRRSSSSNVWAA